MKKREGFVVGLGGKEHEYVLNGVRYIVSARFESSTIKRNTDKTICDRVESYVGSDFADLMPEISDDKLAAEYVYSAAGKED